MNIFLVLTSCLSVLTVISVLLKARLQAKIINGELIYLDGKIYVAKQLELEDEKK